MGKLSAVIKRQSTNPDFTGAYYNLAGTLRDIGQLDGALGCYKKVIELNPDFTGAYYNSGVILQEQKQFDEAIDRYQKVLELNANDADHIITSELSWKKKDYRIEQYPIIEGQSN